MFARRSNVPLSSSRSIVSTKRSLTQLSSCILTIARPPRDDDDDGRQYPSKHSDRLVEERDFHYMQAHQRHHRNKPSALATLPGNDSATFSVSFDSSSSQRRETPSPASRNVVLGTGCMGEGWDELYFPVSFPEKSYTVTEICLDDEGDGSGTEVTEICLDGNRPCARTTCVVRCDDNSVWSDVTDDNTGLRKGGGSFHWRESDENDAARVFVPPNDVVFVRRHVQFRFEI